MTLWEELARASSTPESPLHGLEPQNVLAMLQALARLRSIATTKGGGPTNLTQIRRLETTFRGQFDLTWTQFKYLTDLYDGGKVADVLTASRASPPPSIGGVTPAYGRSCFASDEKTCCGERLQVHFMGATVYDRNECFDTRHAVKTCREGCGSRYYLGKCVTADDFGDKACHFHLFDAWADGKVPLYIASMSGKVIISTAYLTDVAIIQCKTRASFETIAKAYNDAVRGGRGEATPRLTGLILLECWLLLAVLKHRQGVGPCLWFPPVGQTLVAKDPKEVGLIEPTGEQSEPTDCGGLQSGRTDCAGLLFTVERISQTMWANAGYTGHSCGTCRQDIVREGSGSSVQAAVVSGVTATRRLKCTVYDCPLDLPGLGGERFCEAHEKMHGYRCAITTPALCYNPHQPNRLTCEDHSSMEDTLLHHNSSEEWCAKQCAVAEGKPHDTANVNLRRSMPKRHRTFGHLVASYCCGIVAGIAPLWENEGSKQVAAGLNEIWKDPASRPGILFSDFACRRRRHLLRHLDPTWDGTRNFVDRFHYQNHDGTDCHEICNPMNTDDPFLWHLDEDNKLVFKWNDSMAESNHAFVSGLGHIVRDMPRALGHFVLTTNILVHNELLLAGEL